MSILIENVSKKFGTTYALKNVNLEINSGSLTALVGPSGSGKSTLLRIIAGFEKPETGRIWLFGTDSTNQTIEKREIGFVFQNYALFPHLTVWENIAFGLKIKKVSFNRIKERVKELLELIQLENFSENYPYQLSGGQRQRVALARAMAIEPKLLLLDEPFGALDPKVRKDLRTWLKNLHSQVPLTTLLVTHDQQEAMEVADQLVVFCDGKVDQFGTPKEIYDSPATDFVMNFVGQSNNSFNLPEVDKINGNCDAPKQISFTNLAKVTSRPHGYYLTPTSSIFSATSSSLSSLHSEVRQTTVTTINKIIYGESLMKLELKLDNSEQLFKYQTSRKSFEKLLNSNVPTSVEFSINAQLEHIQKKTFILNKKKL